MSRFLSLLASFATAAVLLTATLSAQEKDEKDEKKDPEPKPEVKKVVIEEIPPYSRVITAKITKTGPESQRDFSIAQYVVDPQKQAQFNQWYQSQMAGLRGGQPQQMVQKMNQFKQELARKQNDPNTLHVMKDFDLRATETCKIRSQGPPVEFDDKGNLKKWTAKELATLKGNSKLPGYPADIDGIRPGVFVQVYLAKQAPTPKTKIAPKVIAKKAADDDDVPAMSPRTEVVMIVIMGDGK